MAPQSSNLEARCLWFGVATRRDQTYMSRNLLVSRDGPVLPSDYHGASPKHLKYRIWVNVRIPRVPHRWPGPHWTNVVATRSPLPLSLSPLLPTPSTLPWTPSSFALWSVYTWKPLLSILSMLMTLTSFFAPATMLIFMYTNAFYRLHPRSSKICSRFLNSLPRIVRNLTHLRPSSLSRNTVQLCVTYCDYVIRSRIQRSHWMGIAV